ncbi:unnamed protein product [Hydatigera taeniaeformis]|uniref:SH2 domain-containing protein n=1 Tax=Hydatigena taeniaeformis TaxID=6205 RepID=A0A0R3X1B9_HYDTA|nr:unnamed protein product [Hydatigera taeniaeformis]
MEPQEKSFSPIGSWRNLSVGSKSASTSSGYGTPCAVHGESYCRHTAVPCSSASTGYYTRHDANLSFDIMVEDTKLDASANYRKKSYNAHKQRSGGTQYHRLSDNSSPPRCLECQRKVTADKARLFDASPGPRRQQMRQYRPAHHLGQHQYSQVNRNSYGYYRDHCNPNHNYHRQNNSPYFSSSTNAINICWNENDESYPPVHVVRPSPPIYRAPLRSLDEEATEIYNELLDTADMLALMEQKTRPSEALRTDAEVKPPSISQRRKSCCDLPTVVLLKESKEKITSRPFPKPLDRRRQRRTDQQRTPTNMTPQCPPRKPRPIHHSVDALMLNRDEESALAALEAVVNLDYLKPKPSRLTNSGANSGPTQIIRAYLGETEDGWVGQQARHVNGNVSPNNHSCVEIDGDDDDTEKLGPETLPLDTLDIGTVGQGSGSYSEFTTSEDTSCPSDLEV